jgi:hypothetical protein
LNFIRTVKEIIVSYLELSGESSTADAAEDHLRAAALPLSGFQFS